MPGVAVSGPARLARGPGRTLPAHQGHGEPSPRVGAPRRRRAATLRTTPLRPKRHPDDLPLVLRPVSVGAQHAVGMRVRRPGPLEACQCAGLDLACRHQTMCSSIVASCRVGAGVAAGTAVGGDPLLRLFLVLAEPPWLAARRMLGYASCLHQPAAARDRAHGGMCMRRDRSGRPPADEPGQRGKERRRAIHRVLLRFGASRRRALRSRPDHRPREDPQAEEGRASRKFRGVHGHTRSRLRRTSPGDVAGW
jgi:hypothetical protein